MYTSAPQRSNAKTELGKVTSTIKFVFTVNDSF